MIEEVDFVWSANQSLSELVGTVNCYDYIIASHVIEHIPDLISFLQSCEKLLTDRGVLSFVIPDKRFCFDYFNPITKTGELIDAWISKSKKPSPGKIFDHFSNASKKDQIAWSIDTKDDIELVHNFLDAKGLFEFSMTHDDYIDVHLWRFTPASLRLIFEDLQQLGLLNLYVALEYDTVGCEFFMNLTKNVAHHNSDRLDLLKKRAKESQIIF